MNSSGDRSPLISKMRPRSERVVIYETTKMPVEKFRVFEEMQAAPVLENTQKPFKRFMNHCARCRMIARSNHPRGVFKFRSIEEAQAAWQRMVSK
jgi:hypothetical protein